MSIVQNWTPDRRSIEMRMGRVRSVFEEMIENPLTLIGVIVVVSFILLALFTPLLFPAQGQDAYQMPRDWQNAEEPPLSEGHLLGTTQTGGDVLYGIAWGSRLSIGLSIAVVTVTAFIGTIVGGVAGFVGGWVDDLLMRVVDALIAIPPLIFALAFVVAVGPAYQNIAIALMAMMWGSYARIIRGEVIHVKNNEYVDAARVAGVSELSLFVRDVLPNAIPPIFVQSTLYFGRVVLIAASLAFIGLAQPGITEWGVMISNGQSDLVAGRWWTSVFPGIAIFLWAFGWNMIGDGLRDVLDPRALSE
ncbi:ABC transporter permease [Saliphagus sp. GCM10025334]